MDSKEVKIDNTIYVITKMDAFKAVGVITKILKIIGQDGFDALLVMIKKQLKEVKSKAEEKDKPTNINLAGLEIIATLFPKITTSGMKDSDVQDLLSMLLDEGIMTKIDGHNFKLDAREHFKGKILQMFQLISHVIKYNFIPDG